jgi:hypothetical protein
MGHIMKNIIEAIPKLYKKNKSGKYYVEFEDVFFADKFSKGIKKQLKQLGFTEDACNSIVIQSMGKIYMDINSAEKIYNVEVELCGV